MGIDKNLFRRPIQLTNLGEEIRVIHQVEAWLGVRDLWCRRPDTKRDLGMRCRLRRKPPGHLETQNCAHCYAQKKRTVCRAKGNKAAPSSVTRGATRAKADSKILFLRPGN